MFEAKVTSDQADLKVVQIQLGDTKLDLAVWDDGDYSPYQSYHIDKAIRTNLPVATGRIPKERR